MEPTSPRIHIDEIQFQSIILITMLHTNAYHRILNVRRYDHFKYRQWRWQATLEMLKNKALHRLFCFYEGVYCRYKTFSINQAPSLHHMYKYFYTGAKGANSYQRNSVKGSEYQEYFNFIFTFTPQ